MVFENVIGWKDLPYNVLGVSCLGQPWPAREGCDKLLAYALQETTLPKDGLLCTTCQDHNPQLAYAFVS